MTDQTDTLNVRIKQIPGPNEQLVHATTKVCLVAGNRRARYLEPGDVVALNRELAQDILSKIPGYVELTAEPANRPLYYATVNDAEMTSQSYNPITAGRAEEAKAAMARIQEEINQGALNAPGEVDLATRKAQLDAREAELNAREAQLKAQQLVDSDTLEAQLDADLEDYKPDPNNAHSREAIKQEIVEPPAESVADNPAPTPRKRRRPKAS